jgi:cytochrome c biogenesis protein CcdA/thiol-disulfide isomerase/thioredoxin
LALLLGIGFVAGVITAVSPCVFPVLPIVLAGGAAGGRRRPYAIAAGLVVSFTTFTLSASALLSALGLPQDTLRDAGIALLFLLAATLLFPWLGAVVEAPLSRLSRRPSSDLGGGFVLGLSLGLVFVPCAGPVLATVSVLAAEHRVGAKLVLLTLFYAAGAALVLLLVALGGLRVAGRLRATRAWWRPALGLVIAGAALAIVFNLDETLQTRVGSYTAALQRHTEESGYSTRRLKTLRGTSGAVTVQRPRQAPGAAALPRYGVAPAFVGIADWLNTPGGKSVPLASLRGKVVLVDFWTYSCINCLRTLPHLRAWYERYHAHGFEIVGVHTPEFAFEHVPGNVADAVRRLHVTWPVALDNDYATWNAYSNQYWPADYLVDQNGEVRAATFGEGDYASTEAAIRELLRVGGKTAAAPDLTPSEPTTPETYLGPARLDPSRYVGSALVRGKEASYTLAASVPQNAISFGGEWTLSGQTATAGLAAKLRLHYHAKDVYLVLGGRGRVTVTRGGEQVTSIHVTADRLYPVLDASQTADGILQLTFTPGVRAYSFTFG